jgi:hypothetical protein
MKIFSQCTLIFIGITFFSCVKAHECTCTQTVTSNDPNVAPVVTTSTIPTNSDMSAKDAKAYCNGQDSDVYDGSNTTKKDCNYKD